ncbi:MAG: transglutaminase-like domain-containing protein [Bacteroidota bacterium]|nr:transglutaminase-like domain-containing protein [Candidatus Kapabacteria bacterium]MDW8074447.1 transglutaminase-like domain-containing protein [Bacteroidota bacterium]MDW8271077.1 transglutaminase-like domain-containing protein [Bacteroidota bacterium]
MIQNNPELSALLSLLDDSDPAVTTAVQQRLLSYGHQIVPLLRQIVTSTPAYLPQSANALACIRALQTDALAQLVDSIVTSHLNATDIQLEDALFLLSAFGYPEHNMLAWRQYLDSLASEVSRYACALPTSSEMGWLVALNIVLFEREQFRGAVRNYHSAQHTYFSSLLQTKEGIPISLSCLYLLVAKRVGIELWGIGMPLHFIVYHPGLDVFIDPFNAGTLISQQECKRFIEQAGFSFSDSMLARRTNLEIILRTMRNLIYAHTRSGDKWEAETLSDALDTIVHIVG